MDDHDPNACVACGMPVRPFVTPIPEGADVAWSESITGRAHYCQECFDEMGGPADG